MTVLKYLLNGLEAELTLERELGIRSVEVDVDVMKDLLGDQKPSAPIRPPDLPTGGIGVASREVPKPVRPAPAASSGKTCEYDFVFLHDRPLGEKARLMMGKIVAALGRTFDTAPVIVEPPIPRAKVYVFLGAAALRKYMPEERGGFNRWIKSPKGKDILLVRSPEEILRFPEVTPMVKQMKYEMWKSLQSVYQHLDVRNRE